MLVYFQRLSRLTVVVVIGLAALRSTPSLPRRAVTAGAEERGSADGADPSGARATRPAAGPAAGPVAKDVRRKRAGKSGEPRLAEGLPATLPFGQGTPFPIDPTRVLESFFGPAPAAERAAWQDIEISQEEERRVGDAAVERLLADLRRRDIAVARGGRDVEYLEKLVELLRPRLRNAKRYPKIRVLLASSEWTDARSIPGGTLVFFRGIIDFAGSEAALVGVVGHELSHLDRGHQLYDRRLVEAAKQRFGNMAKRNPALGDPALGDPALGEPAAGEPAALWADGLALARGFARPLRPEEETEADRDAVAWMVAAGYDPRSLAELFRRWDRRERERGAAPPAVLDFLRSHPPHAARHADVLAEAARLNAQPGQEPSRLYVGTRNLRERVTRDERRFPE